ncbi:MAG: hypothetical protein AB8G05_02580 [Oligoflexales bacterium]
MKKNIFYLLTCIFSTSASTMPDNKMILSLLLLIYSTSFFLNSGKRSPHPPDSKLLYLGFKQLNPNFNDEIHEHSP